jgi:glycine/D-amino acid oxidase-like deaminating enzyme
MVARRADVIVVGAGGFGTSIAFHLARLGAGVLLLDRSAAASETTAMAAGIAMQVHPTEAASRLALDSLAMIEQLKATTGRALAYHRAGSIKVARTDAHAVIVRDEIAFGRRLGVAIDPLSAAEAEALAPWLALDSATAISIVRRDLHFEPTDLPHIYLDAARRHGAVLAEGTAVRRLLIADGAVTGVETDDGPIAARVVVIAAGGWSAGLVAAAGCDLPAVPVRHELFVTAPIDGIAADSPHVRVMDANAYARPYRGGLMFGAYETGPTEVQADDSPGGLPPTLASPVSALRERAAPVLDVIPGLAGATAVEVRAGVPTMSPDGTFIVDALTGAAGAYVVAGDNVMGLHVSPAVGALLASWIVDGKRPARLVPFGLGRFSHRAPDELHAAALAQYATKYQHLDEAVSP